jgi:hypothetical protein
VRRLTSIPPERTPQHRALRIKLCVSVFCLSLGLAILSSHFSSKPDGVYYDPHVGSAGNAYWIFQAGQIQLKTSGPTRTSAPYSLSGSSWVSADGTTVLQPNLLGIKIVDKTNSANNRFLFRRGLGWVADAWDFVADRRH